MIWRLELCESRWEWCQLLDDVLNWQLSKCYIYTADSFAQPTKLKLPNLTFTKPNLSYQTYKNQYTILNPTKSKLPNQTFAKHTYWTKPYKRNRLNQICSIQLQELKHPRKQTNSTPGSVEPLKSLAMIMVAFVRNDGDRWKTSRTLLWLGSNQSECFRCPWQLRRKLGLPLEGTLCRV